MAGGRVQWPLGSSNGLVPVRSRLALRPIVRSRLAAVRRRTSNAANPANLANQLPQIGGPGRGRPPREETAILIEAALPAKAPANCSSKTQNCKSMENSCQVWCPSRLRSTSGRPSPPTTTAWTGSPSTTPTTPARPSRPGTPSTPRSCPRFRNHLSNSQRNVRRGRPIRRARGGHRGAQPAGLGRVAPPEAWAARRRSPARCERRC